MKHEETEQPEVTQNSSEREKIDYISTLLDQSGEDGDKTAGDDTEAADSRGDSAADEPDTGDDESTDGVDDDTEGEPDTETEGDAGSEEVSLAEIAKELGVDTADLYEARISLGGDESVSLGELKDNYKEMGPVAEAQQRLDQDKDDLERTLMRTRAELQAMMQIVPDDMRQALIQRSQVHAEQWEHKQEKQVLEAIPTWKDPVVREQDRVAIVDVGREYGFSEAEITYTRDARTQRLLRDFAKARQQIADSKAAAKKVPGKPNAPTRDRSGKFKQGKSTRLRKAMARAKAPNASEQDRVAAVGELLSQ